MLIAMRYLESGINEYHSLFLFGRVISIAPNNTGFGGEVHESLLHGFLPENLHKLYEK
jgi:hypothetical protein